MRAGEVCLVGGGGDGARETVHNWPSLWHFPHNEQTAGWSMLGLVLAAKGPGSDAQNSTNHPPSPANQPAARPRPDQWRSWRPLLRVRQLVTCREWRHGATPRAWVQVTAAQLSLQPTRYDPENIFS